MKPLLKLDPEDPFRVQAEEMFGDLKKHQHSAEELLEKSQSLELAEDWKGAYRTYRQILDAHPRSQIAKELRIPVLIQSLPPGLEVSEVGATGQRKALGRTPHVLNLVPEGSLEIQLAAPGYTPVRAEVQVIDGHERRFVLLRKPAWRAALDGAVEVPPVIHGRRIIAGTQKGSLQSLAIENGQAVWTRLGEAIKSIVASPLVVEEGIFTVWSNGKLLRPATRRRGSGRQGDGHAGDPGVLPGQPRDLTAPCAQGSRPRPHWDQVRPPPGLRPEDPGQRVVPARRGSGVGHRGPRGPGPCRGHPRGFAPAGRHRAAPDRKRQVTQGNPSRPSRPGRRS